MNELKLKAPVHSKQPCLRCGFTGLFCRPVQTYMSNGLYHTVRIEYECPCGFQWISFQEGSEFHEGIGWEGTIRYAIPATILPGELLPDVLWQSCPPGTLLIIQEYPLPV